MNLELWPDDLRDDAQDVHLHNLSYEHFTDIAQAALRLIGRGVFFRWKKDGYRAVHPPKDLAQPESAQPTIEQLTAEIAELRAKLTRQGSKKRPKRCLCRKYPVSERNAGRGHTKDRCPNYLPTETAASERPEARQ